MQEQSRYIGNVCADVSGILENVVCPPFKLKHCSWQDSSEALTAVRRAVFIEEQHVPKALELDEADKTYHHVLVTNADNQPIGTGRIGPDGHIGRMAVLKAYRRQGVGSALLAALLDYAMQEQYSNVYLHAQLSAIPFYERHGFVAEGEEFMDAGIAHRNMILDRIGDRPRFSV